MLDRSYKLKITQLAICTIGGPTACAVGEGLTMPHHKNVTFYKIYYKTLGLDCNSASCLVGRT
jgi:hypothetical protein